MVVVLGGDVLDVGETRLRVTERAGHDDFGLVVVDDVHNVDTIKRLLAMPSALEGWGQST